MGARASANASADASADASALTSPCPRRPQEYALSKCEADAALTRTIDTLRERQGRAAEW